jgi:hypothetical protein
MIQRRFNAILNFPRLELKFSRGRTSPHAMLVLFGLFFKEHQGFLKTPVSLDFNFLLSIRCGYVNIIPTALVGDIKPPSQ